MSDVPDVARCLDGVASLCDAARLRHHVHVGGAEIWDLLDRNGRPVGRTHARADGDVPRGLFHAVSTVCVVEPSGRLLTTLRARRKQFGRTWELPGGSALAGEAPAEAAVRELREETGLDTAKGAMTPVGRHTEAAAYVFLFLLRLPERPDRLRLDPLEVERAEWVLPAEFHRRLGDPSVSSPWPDRLTTFARPLARALGGPASDAVQAAD